MKVVAFVKRHLLLLAALSVLGAFAAVHVIWYIHPSDLESYEELEAILTDGRPTVVEFYSNF